MRTFCNRHLQHQGDTSRIQQHTRPAQEQCSNKRSACHPLTWAWEATSSNLKAFKVAVSVRTLPKTVVRPISSSSGELNAERMAMPSSTSMRDRPCQDLFSSFAYPSDCSTDGMSAHAPMPGSVSMMSFFRGAAMGGWCNRAVAPLMPTPHA